MVRYDYDLLVIGAGSGGVAASRRAALHGAKVAICEADRVGGTCVIRGCVPKKLLVYASHFSEAFHDAKGYGWTLPQAPSFDWPTLIAHKDKEIDRLNGIYEKMLSDGGVELIRGHARFKDAHSVVVGNKTVTARYILIATGGAPTMPDIPGIQHAITSNEAFHLPQLPKTVAVVGGGYIAVEFAGIFNGLGSKVTQLYRGDAMLRGFDQDIRAHLTDEMGKKGVVLRTATNVTAIEKKGGGCVLALTDGTSLEVDAVMFATGRSPNTAGLGLDEVGVALREDGAVKVNANSQTSVPHIYAVGDVTNRMNLTPVAINEGRAFADSCFGNQPRSVDHRNVPSAVFSQPSVGTVGLTEEAAREEYGQVDIYKTTFRPMKHTMTGSQDRTLVKLVVEVQSGRVVGAHMVGEDAAEIIQGLGIALQCGATKEQFDSTMAVHPSAAEEFVMLRKKSIV